MNERAADDVRDTEEEVKRGCRRRDVCQMTRSKILFQLKCFRDSDQWESKHNGVMDDGDNEHDVGDEEQQCINNVTECWTNQDGKCHCSCSLITLNIPSVVTVKDGFSVESERKSEGDCSWVDVSTLRHETEQDADGTEDDHDEDVSEADVLQSQSTSVQEGTGDAAEVDQG